MVTKEGAQELRTIRECLDNAERNFQQSPVCGTRYTHNVQQHNTMELKNEKIDGQKA